MAVIYNVTVCYNIFLLLENAVKNEMILNINKKYKPTQT